MISTMVPKPLTEDNQQEDQVYDDHPFGEIVP